MILLLCGSKGFNLLASLDAETRCLISWVIYDKDSTLANDCSHDIARLSADLSIKCVPWSNSMDIYLKEELFKRDLYCIAIGWRRLINGIEERLIVLHDSLLPKYRGFAPTVAQLLDGVHEVGVTAFWATEGYDEGDIIKISKTYISYPCRIEQAFDAISNCYLECVEYVLKQGQGVRKNIVKQSTLGSPTYSLWRDEYDYFVNWSLAADEIVRFVDATSQPYDGAQFLIRGERYILDEASVSDKDVEIEGTRHTGKIFRITERGPLIVAGKGLVLASRILLHSTREQVQIKSLRTRLYRPTYHEFVTCY